MRTEGADRSSMLPVVLILTERGGGVVESAPATNLGDETKCPSGWMEST